MMLSRAPAKRCTAFKDFCSVQCRRLAVAAGLATRDSAKARLSRVDAERPFAPQLIDTFNRRHDYLRISLTEKCNLRCFYCMPEEGVPLSPKEHLLTDEEVIRLAELFVRNGVTKIRLTGGEPTVRRGFVDLVGRLSHLRPLGLKSIGMTSNGLALHRKLPDLVKNGMTHLNLSLDTLDEFKFELITRRRGHDAVLRSLDTALQLQPDLQSIKINVVVVKGLNDAEVLDFVEMTKDKPISVRFIEFMPFTGNKWDKAKMVSSAELLGRVKAQYPTMRKAADELNDTARSYLIPGHKGSVAFISSMSDHFCGTCNRLRITADGNIKVCLFGPNELSLRDALRSGASDEDLMTLVGQAVGRKKEKHAGAMPIYSARGNYATLGLRLQRPQSVSLPLSLYLAPSRQRIAMMHSTASRLIKDGSNPIDYPPAKLTHLDDSGRPSMVDVSSKSVTKRTATAEGRIHLNDIAFSLISDALSAQAAAAVSSSSEQSKAIAKALSKGPVLLVAELAGIHAAKQTSSLIPLCHPLSLSHISVSLTPHAEDRTVRCKATVRCEGRTGVEMEALTAASVALLTVWDMVKAVAGREMRIDGVKVVEKTGGKSGNWVRVEDTPGGR